MVEWLEWARGPAFIFAFTLMVLGLIRNVLLTLWSTAQALMRAGDKKIPWKDVIVKSFEWIVPLKKIKERIWYSLFSIFFHVGLILVPVFLIEHVALWRRGIGLSWPTLSQSLADGLTLLTLIMIAFLLIGRLANRTARALNRSQDILILLLLTVPFISGYLAAHPGTNPFNYQATMLIHVLSGDFILCLVPFTKLCHCVLLPLTQLVSEVGWHFPPGVGKKVALLLGKEIDSV